MSGIQFENYDLLESRYIAAAVDALISQYTGACTCPRWLIDLVEHAHELKKNEALGK